MSNHDWDHFTESVGEQLQLIAATFIGTIILVGFILLLAL